MKLFFFTLFALCTVPCNTASCHSRLPLINEADSITIDYWNTIGMEGVKNYKIHISPYDYFVRSPYLENCQDSLLMPLISLSDSLFAQASIPMYTHKECSGENLFADGNILQVTVFRKGKTKTIMLPQMGIYSPAPSETEDGCIGIYSLQYRLFIQRLNYVIATLSGLDELAKYWNNILEYKYDKPDKIILFPVNIPLYGKNKDNKLCDKIIEKALSTVGSMPYIYKYAYNLGKDIIPMLISHINDQDNGETWFCDFLDSYDQLSPRYLSGNRIGIRYAHLIDFLVTTDSVSMSRYCQSKTTKEWENPSRFFKVYSECIISKKDDSGNLSDDVLDYDDMSRIKDIYQRWWDENKKYNLEIIRKRWNKKYGLLKKTDYGWR